MTVRPKVRSFVHPGRHLGYPFKQHLVPAPQFFPLYPSVYTTAGLFFSKAFRGFDFFLSFSFFFGWEKASVATLLGFWGMAPAL